jgi:hypothetical protein
VTGVTDRRFADARIAGEYRTLPRKVKQAANLLSKDEVWRVAANIAKLPELLRPKST